MMLPVSLEEWLAFLAIAVAVGLLFYAHAVGPFIQYALDRRRREQERIYRIALYSLRDYREGRR